jgi:hypothetical protein
MKVKLTRVKRAIAVVSMLSLAIMALPAAAQVTATAALVTVGSPTGVTPQNHQNEPAVAIDANHPNFMVAGVNDFVDWAPCPERDATGAGTCADPADDNVGLSGVYFSFDSGHSWTQPTYTGWTALDCDPTAPCTPHVGPIHTLPWYYENRLISNGDPAVAVGPMPDAHGHFSWSNGSRVYYANLAANFGAVYGPFHGSIRGLLGVAVSRLDNPTPERVQQKSSWMAPVVVIRRAGTFTLEDKEQIWADNAASSPFFGRVYTCNAEFRAFSPGGQGIPVPVNISYSSDGGDTWVTHQIPGNSGGGRSFIRHGYLDGCTVRTDSQGVVYLFLNRVTVGQENVGYHALYKSYDGGRHWSHEMRGPTITNPTFEFDPVYGRPVMDGYAGARIDLAAGASVDIANGAPTGADATNAIIDAWSDGRGGLNNEKTMVSWSTNGGVGWSNPVAVSLPGDRSMYAAPAIAPNGSTVYVMYEGPTAPWRGADMTSPRPYHGVFLSAPFGPGGPGAWTTLYNGPLGDLRGTYPGHDLYQERVGDYVYAAATRSYGVGVWTDAADAAVCPAIQDFRAASLAAGERVLPAPWPLAVCPATFGNTQIMSVTTAP